MEINSIDLIILFGSALLAVYLYIHWAFKFWQRKNIPYLKPNFPFGNFEPIWSMKKGLFATMGSFYAEIKSKGYKYAGVYMSVKPILVIADLDLIRNILIKDFQHFVDRGFYHNEKADPLTMHLFSIEGDRWRELRAKLTPTFTSGKMKAMFQLVLNCANGLENQINDFMIKKEPVDIKRIGALFTTNVIGSCAFGLDCNCFEDPDNEFRIYAKEFLDGGIMKIIRFFTVLGFPKLCKKFGVRMFPKRVTDFYMKITRDMINLRKSTNTKRNDFLDLLLEIKSINGDSLTFLEIAAQVFAFFLAGFETSSSTMTFAFYEMAKNQNIQNRVREEIRKVLNKHDGKVTYDAIMEMTYMQQVFDETLRKYPILAALPRICTKDYEIPGEDTIIEKETLRKYPILSNLQRICTKDYKIPNEDIIIEKGTSILIPLLGIHHDPELYPEPEKFDPERFSPENKAKLHPCAYMPFGEGPRICIGLRFGIMQAKVGMTVMLKDYKYSISPKSPAFKLNPVAPMLAPVGEVLLDIEKV